MGLGKQCVVGANAVVMGNFPDGSVIAPESLSACCDVLAELQVFDARIV